MDKRKPTDESSSQDAIIKETTQASTHVPGSLSAEITNIKTMNPPLYRGGRRKVNNKVAYKVQHIDYEKHFTVKHGKDVENAKKLPSILRRKQQATNADMKGILEVHRKAML